MDSQGGDRTNSKPRLEIVPKHQGQSRSNTGFGYKHTDISSDLTTTASPASVSHTHAPGNAPNYYHVPANSKDRVSYVPGPERYSIDHRLSTRSTASTRDSIASSILSRSLSTASTALSRYSSVRSSAGSEPVFTSPISPWSPYPGKETADPPRCYWCTLCGTHFESINEWKSHELGCHDAHFLRAAPEDVVVNTVRASAQRSAWGCGFCAEYTLSLPEYLDHVGRHYEEGRSLNEWRHSSVIKGLLRQPGLAPAWRALISKRESVSGADATFHWDHKITGRSSDYIGTNAPRLQDLLECFGTGEMKPQAMAKAAYDLACVASSDQAEDTAHELSMHIDVDSMVPGNIEATHIQYEPPAYSQSAYEVDDKVISSYMARHINSQGRTSESPDALPPTVPPRISSQKYPSKIYAKVEGIKRNTPELSSATSSGDASTVLLPQRRSALRRTESERNLSVPKSSATVSPGVFETEENHSSELSESPSASQDQPNTADSRLSPLPVIRESASESRMDSLVVAEPNEASSIRSHDNSSVLSAQTGVSSVGHDDSASEPVSHDSSSEPDLLLEVEGDSAASREWSRVYHLTVERVMEQLWSQYNHDWDQLIRTHAGGSSSNHSRGREQPASRRQASGSSRYTPGRTLQPSGRNPIDGEDEDDDLGRDPGRAYSARSSPVGPKKFACPFRKHDPQTYNIHDHQVCTTNAWPTIPRLKFVPILSTLSFGKHY